MMSKKILPIILVLTGAGLFLTFQTQGKSDNDNPKSKRNSLNNVLLKGLIWYKSNDRRYCLARMV